ncbi:MAG: hypothetical protein LKJ17_10690 [Oscillospiraceae bacterium]|jgi:hypothetical protein|nr:hypothetical protein [Oscillospiraceae bacterium]
MNEMSNPVKLNENVKQRSLIVYSIELLYKIADAGYLEQLNEVRPDRLKPNKRIYYFDRDPELEKIIKDYQTQRQKEKAEKQEENKNTYTLSDEDKKSIIDGIIAELKSNKTESGSSDTNA